MEMQSFQQLKLDVFQIMVEKYGVKAFALEADYGCCETANRYIHGGEGTAEQAADALDFQIYKTDEMANLLRWMREYNETAGEGEDICFLDFSKIPDESVLKNEVTGYCYMGSLGENQLTLLNRIVMSVLPYTYRIWGSPASMYDGMIFVTEAHPTEIR